jgi:hypothetical protein
MKRWILLAVLGGVGAVMPAVGQCALCRSAVETGDPSFAAALRGGILLLLVMPYLLGVGIALAIWRWRRRRRIAIVQN